METYKQFERKPPDLIKERVDNSYMAHMTSALTSVRGVNKTDVTTLVSNFGVRQNVFPPSLSLSPPRNVHADRFDCTTFRLTVIQQDCQCSNCNTLGVARTRRQEGETFEGRVRREFPGQEAKERERREEGRGGQERVELSLVKENQIRVRNNRKGYRLRK